MITAALLGNPNVGKTTLFNSLTGSNQYVGNWAGVTVEKKEGYLNASVKIVDLPGIYAMDTFSNEEKISKEYLKNGNVDVIINIVDATNLNRNLYLTTQLKSFGKPVVLVLNMIDLASARGIAIDYAKLSEKLGVSVLAISASKGSGIEELKGLLTKGVFFKTSIDNDYQIQNGEKRESSDAYPFESEKEIYKYLDGILKECIIKSGDKKASNTVRIDKIILNKYIAYPIFAGILYFIFQLTFSWVGQPLADLFDSLLNRRLVPLLNWLLESSSPWFRSLLVNGIVGGVGAVIVFLPVILTLFLGVSFLEDSGYMARAALIMDRVMRRMGLSGKAFIPLIMGFGCSVPAVMSARTLESEKDRKLAALLVPLMSCNARLPVYALFAGALFKGHEGNVVASLYFLGIIAAFIMALIFKRVFFKKNEEPFIIELPEYKMPELKNLLLHTWEKGKGFLRKAGTIIFSASVIIWFLSNFNFTGMVDINSSFLAGIGNVITPIFAPLGFASWQNSVALLTGIIAKEVVIGTLGVIYKGNLTATLPTVFSGLSAYSFLVFVLLYTPCVSLLATMRKEYGNRMAAFSLTYQAVLAWIVSFVVYNLGGIMLKLF